MDPVLPSGPASGESASDGSRASGSQGTKAFQRAEREARVRSSGVGIPTHPSKPAPRSGTMPDARGLVLCPYCRKTYPYSLGLLNRQLRCSGCKAVFRVSEDRRSFRMQEPPPLPSEETGSISRSTRLALKDANDNLKEIATQALRQLTRHDQQRPSSAAVVAYSPASNALTQKVKRPQPLSAKPNPNAIVPVLTGEGLADEKRRRTWWFALAAVVAVVAILVMALQPDERREALWAFQRANGLDQSRAGRVAQLQQRSLSGTVSPIVAIDDARLASSVVVSVAPLQAVIGNLQRVGRSPLWADPTRMGEATALLEKADLNLPGALDKLVARCAKSGLTVRTTDEILQVAQAALPAGAEDIWSVLLAAPAPRRGGIDPAALLGAGQLPTSVTIVPFSGDAGELLQASGPAKVVAYQGRLMRCVGPGWSGQWQVFDLR